MKTEKQKVKEARDNLKSYFCKGIFHKINKKEHKYILPPRQCPTFRKKYPNFKNDDCKIAICKPCRIIHEIFRGVGL